MIKVSSANTETVDDIVDEMRERAELMQIHGSLSGVEKTIKEFAKRVFESHNREVSKILNKINEAIYEISQHDGRAERKIKRILREITEIIKDNGGKS